QNGQALGISGCNRFPGRRSVKLYDRSQSGGGRRMDSMVMPAATVLRFSEIELNRRARQVRLLLTDCDGVLTDTGVYYSERGEELKRFSIRDGMGVELLRNAGIETGIISGEKSPSLVRRAEKLRISQLYLNTTNKLACLETILRETQLLRGNIAWIGD